MDTTVLELMSNNKRYIYDNKGTTNIQETRENVLSRVTTRGLSGLSNLGNTCYMNAALQALSVTKPLLAYFLAPNSDIMKHIESRILNEKYIEHEKKNLNDDLELDPDDIENEATNTLTYKLKKTFDYMWKRNCEVTPITFKKCIDIKLKQFGGTFQHDSQEFLTFLLDTIHEEVKGDGNINITMPEEIEYKILLDTYENELSKNKDNSIDEKQVILHKIHDLDVNNHQLFLKIKSIIAWEHNIKKAYSIINDIFSGQTLTTNICEECKYSNYKFERFDILTLHLPEKVDISKTEYKLEELLDGYMSSEELTGNNKYNCNYCCTKTNANKSIIIYQQSTVLVLMIKKFQEYNGSLIKNNIKINYNHELDMTPYMHEYSIGNKLYELYATIRHSGGMRGGHYYTYAKNPINNLWFLYNDGTVYHVDDDEPLNCNGYVLFYRQKI